jgi:hypothetical protein
MPSPFDFCLPSRSTAVPHTPDWLHEIKYDGYRLRLERDGDRVRLITKGGHNWTSRYPWIVEAALKNRHKQFAIVTNVGVSQDERRCARTAKPCGPAKSSPFCRYKNSKRPLTSIAYRVSVEKRRAQLFGLGS